MTAASTAATLHDAALPPVLSAGGPAAAIPGGGNRPHGPGRRGRQRSFGLVAALAPLPRVVVGVGRPNLKERIVSFVAILVECNYNTFQQIFKIIFT